MDRFPESYRHNRKDRLSRIARTLALLCQDLWGQASAVIRCHPFRIGRSGCQRLIKRRTRADPFSDECNLLIRQLLPTEGHIRLLPMAHIEYIEDSLPASQALRRVRDRRRAAASLSSPPPGLIVSKRRCGTTGTAFPELAGHLNTDWTSSAAPIWTKVKTAQARLIVVYPDKE